jgi:rSAM/selenodomain-associated transferase 2
MRAHQSAAPTPQVSIVIPTRNDAEALARTLDHLHQLPDMDAAEVIVAAAGDREGTERAVAGRAQLLWPDGSTRAILMNAGAARARGKVLFFLHADSFPPIQALELTRQALSDPSVGGGAFEHQFVEPVWSLRVINWINRMRYRLTQNFYGDQGVFVRADVFHQMGGYRDLRLMEDLDFSQRLRRVRRTVLVRAPLRTSGRRFLTRGPWRTFLFIVWLLLLHTLRLDTQRYAECWRGPANHAPGSPWTQRPHPESAGAADERTR